MADIALPLSSERAASRSTNWLPMLCVAALVVGIAGRLLAGIDAPLWFDETFSAVIASQRNLPDLLGWMLTELSGPTYYSLLFLWEKLAGNGDIALRVPSLIFSIATPLLILWRGHPDRNVRMLWAALIALSTFAIDTATQARPQALLLLLASLQAVIFLRLIRAPNLGVALAWTTLSASMVLTHYHAAIICGLQGITFVALCRMQAVRLWPAALPLLPMAIWMRFHLPFLFGYAGKDTVWYSTLGPDALWIVPSLITGLALPGTILLVCMAISLMRDGIASARHRKPWPYRTGEMALFACGLIAATIVVGMGFLTPSFTIRYLLPYVPAILAGIAIWARRMGPAMTFIAALLLVPMIAAIMSQTAAHVREPQSDFRYAFNFEQPSEWIAKRNNVDRLILLWDSPTAGLENSQKHIAQVGGFFLHRAGKKVAVTTPPWPRHGDPNIELLTYAGDDHRTAIVWAYDIAVPGTRGSVHPWRIPRIDPRWTCRNFGRGSMTMLACLRN